MLPVLEIEHLSAGFLQSGEYTPALKGISLKLHHGELLALVGESGSGKSLTALSVLRLTGAIRKSGQILFSADGTHTVDLAAIPENQLRRIRGNKIGMVFQEPMTSLNPVYTCGYQVVEVLRRHQGVSFGKARSEALHWFEKVRLPDPERIFNSYPHQLSGGQKQRVMIAQAICCRPALLLCDEPTTALDVTVQKTILELISDLQREMGMAVLFITHDLGVVQEISDRAVVMYKGEIVEEGITEQIFRKPIHPYTRGLLACRPALYKKGDRLPVVKDFMDDEHIALPVKKETKSGNEEQHFGENILEARQLSVSFPAKKNFFGRPIAWLQAVNNVSFNVRRGETLGLVGESGCGKSTLGRLLLRLIEPGSGQIFFKNDDITEYKGKALRDLRMKMQIIFQDPFASLNPRITIGKTLAEPILVHRLHANAKARVIELLEKVGLDSSFVHRYPHECSGGQRQRVVIARALAMEPELLVCDESVSALDVSVQAQVLNLLNDLKAEFGFSIIFISHDLSVVRYFCDRIMVMNKGRIVEQGAAEQVWNHPQSDYTKTLLKAVMIHDDHSPA